MQMALSTRGLLWTYSKSTDMLTHRATHRGTDAVTETDSDRHTATYTDKEVRQRQRQRHRHRHRTDVAQRQT